MPGLKSILIGLFWSVIAVTAGALLRLNTMSSSYHGTLPLDLPNYIHYVFIFNLSFVAVIEEAYFRGLIFSFLVMNGWSENKALLFQAILFISSHYMADWNDPVLLFGIVPLQTFFVSWIIKRYKMLYLSIMMHTINNVFGGILVAVL